MNLNFAAAALPELRGYGDLPNLSIAMSLDPDLLAIAQNIAAQSFTDIIANFATVSGQFDQLLFTWAGVEGISPTSRGPFLDDARKLEFLEELLSQEFFQFRAFAQEDPNSIPAENFMRMYADVKELMLGRFLMQARPACVARKTHAPRQRRMRVKSPPARHFYLRAALAARPLSCFQKVA